MTTPSKSISNSDYKHFGKNSINCLNSPFLVQSGNLLLSYENEHYRLKKMADSSDSSDEDIPTLVESTAPEIESSLSKLKVPVTILTGFLGAGKTSLLNYILNVEHNKKIAVILNEFGEGSYFSKYMSNIYFIVMIYFCNFINIFLRFYTS